MGSRSELFQISRGFTGMHLVGQFGHFRTFRWRVSNDWGAWVVAACSSDAILGDPSRVEKPLQRRSLGPYFVSSTVRAAAAQRGARKPSVSDPPPCITINVFW